MSDSESELIQKFGELSYNKSKKLGQGRAGVNVYKGKLMDLDIAVKVIERSDRTENSQLEVDMMKMNTSDTEDKSNSMPSNIKILRSITHQNIIRIYNFELTDEKILMPMELCDKNLSEYLKDNLFYDTKLDILKQIGEGLKFLHTGEKAICHQKLKPQNILIKLQSEKVEVKLTDFGYAEYVEREAVSTSTGTLCNSVWAPPEGCSNELSVDIYTYGRLIKWVLIDQKDKDEGGKSHKTDLLILADLAFDDATQEDPKQRPDICTLIKHPLFWTTMQKGNFLRDIRNDYRKPNNDKHGRKYKKGGFILCFEEKLKEEGKLKNPQHWAEDCDLLKTLINESEYIKKKIKKSYDKQCFNLIALIRNTCAHFVEHKNGNGSEEKQKYKQVLASKTTFIEHVISKYPYLIHDIFTCYREALFQKVKECLDDNYNDYFENLVNSESFAKISAEKIKAHKSKQN